MAKSAAPNLIAARRDSPMAARVIGPTLVVLSLAMTAVPAIVDGQTPNPQVAAPRDSAPTTARPGTATIRGRVGDAQDNRPLRRVRLTLTAAELPPGGIPASTDDEGRYEFTELPAGRFTLTAQRGGFLQLRYGQRRPLEQGRLLDLGEGQVLENINVALPRMGVISGQITDELGEPIAGVWVAAIRSMWWQNRRQRASDGPLTTTDEEGEYRITGLMPGTHVVVARTMEKWVADTSGREEMMSYAPSYFPGVAELSQAVRVTVNTGEELRNISFSVVPGRTARVSGRAVDSQGRALRQVGLSHQFPGGPGGGIVGLAANATVAPDGTFTLMNVPPGDYMLQATGSQESAFMPIAVNSADINDVLLTTSAGWSIRGRIVTESGAPAGLRRDQVTIAPVHLLAPGGLGMPGGAVARQTVNDDWTFSVTNVVGTARLHVTVPDGWAVKAITQGDRDIADLPLEMKSGEQVADVQVVLTDRVGTVTGQVVDEKGVPLADGTVVLFATEPAKWFDGSRFVRALRPDQQGRYRLTSVLPGEYFAVALDYVEQGIWNDPEYLESIRQYAQRLTLNESETHTIALKLVAP
jgi:protocatechuate 3,4-dioxygenase beta subunit